VSLIQKPPTLDGDGRETANGEFVRWRVKVCLHKAYAHRSIDFTGIYRTLKFWPVWRNSSVPTGITSVIIGANLLRIASANDDALTLMARRAPGGN